MPWIKEEVCTGCGDCIFACVVEAIVVLNGMAAIDNNRCHRCGACHDSCSNGAILLGGRASYKEIAYMNIRGFYEKSLTVKKDKNLEIINLSQ